MDLNELAKTATFAGVILLENGAETYRVEETMSRICEQYGASVVDSFATPTIIIVSFSYQDQLVHNIKRVHSRSVDLHKIHQINDLSRNIRANAISVEELTMRLRGIRNEKRYPFPITLLFSGLCTFGFAFFFHGTLKDALAAFLIGILIKCSVTLVEQIKLNNFFVNALGGCVATLMAMILAQIGLAEHLDIVIISSMMLLVPGLAITNAIRDTVSGDLLSGISRTVEAFLVAVAIAIGSGTVFMLLGGF